MELVPIVMYFFRCFALSLSLVLSVRSLAAEDFYSLRAVDIHGNDVSLEAYRGKVNLHYVVQYHIYTCV